MLSKTMLFTTLFMLVACLSQLAVAAPPACVLACINDQPEVNDYEVICGDAVEDVTTCMREKCNGDLSEPALEHYVSVCGDAGIDVVIPTATPSAKPTKSSGTGTSSETATSSSNGTTTETGGPESTDAPTEDDEEGASSKIVINSMLGLVALLAGVIAL